MKNLPLLSVSLLAFCCLASRPKYREHDLVGLWRKSDEWRSAIILRKADGTYREKGFLLKLSFKPPAYYESTGTWRLRNGQFVTTLKSFSEPTYKSSIGKTFRLEVLQVDRQHFRYLSTDGADDIQDRIGDASDAGFAQTKLNPPDGGVTPEAIQKAKKALPVKP